MGLYRLSYAINYEHNCYWKKTDTVIKCIPIGETNPIAENVAYAPTLYQPQILMTKKLSTKEKGGNTLYDVNKDTYSDLVWQTYEMNRQDWNSNMQHGI